METLILIIVLAVVFVAVVAEVGWLTLVRPRRRLRGQPTEVVSPPEAPGRDGRPPPAGAGDDSPVAAPPAPARTPAPPAPEIEKPPPSAGRLVRLRDRLGRGQASLGPGRVRPVSPGPAAP